MTAAPTSVHLVFNDLVLTKPSPPDVIVVGPDGKHYETGCATSEDRDVSVPVGLGTDGRYVVTWRIVSADGHPVSTSVDFTLRAGANFQRAQGSLATRCVARGQRQAAGSTNAAVPQSITASQSSSGWSSGFVWLGVGIVVVAGLAIGGRLWAVRR